MKKLRMKIGFACAFALGVITASGADYATTLSSLNPPGYWRLNETSGSIATGALLNSGTNGASLNGSYYGQPDAQQVGALGTGNDPAVNFNGLNQFAEISQNAGLNPKGPFTVEFWANATNVSSGAKSGVVSRYITVPGGPTGQFGYLFFMNNGNTKWQFRVYDGGAGRTITAFDGPDVAADTWYHVVGVYNGSSISIYVNGTLGNLTNLACSYVPNTNAATRIGAGTPETGPSLYFPGLLDNVSVYHYALSPAEIAAHYDAASTNAAGYNAQILSANPAAYYAMNEPVLPAAPAAANIGALGSTYNGTYVYGSTKGAVGPRKAQFFGMDADNNSVDLNGTRTGPNLSSGFVNIPPLPHNTDHYTMTAWVKRTGSQPNFAGIMATRGEAGTSSGTFWNADGLVYTWNDAPNTYNYNPNLQIPDDVWTFTALTITPTNAVLYLGTTNGLRAATNNVTHAAHDWSVAPLWLGRDTATSRFMKGRIDEAAVFDTYLDYGTISNLFYSSTPAVPMVTRSPAEPATIYEGMTVSFSAYGVATGPLNYQWRKNGANLAGQTASTLSLSNVTVGTSGNYDVVVTSGANSATSAATALTVVAGPPIIAQQPVSATRYQGASLTFSVAIQGSVPWSFQWKKDSSPIQGATSISYTIPSVMVADAGSYTVTITNPLGSTNSAAATLSVLPVDNYAAQIVYGGGGAYWQMNEKSGTTAVDYVGGLNCTIAGQVTNNVASVRPPAYAGFSSTNTCFAYSGNSADYLSTPGSLNFTNNSITMAAWVMPYSGLLGISSDVNFVCNVGSVGLNSAGVDGTIRAHPLWWMDTGLTFSFDTWNYIVVVWTPSGQTFYLDNGDGNGLRASSVSGTIDPSTWKGKPFFIGRQADRTDRGWPGQIDELALFDRELTPAEVTNLYVSAKSGPAAPSIVTQPLSQAVLAGQPVSFTVIASGGAPMNYQWRHAGTNLPGATSRTLSIPSTYYTDAGSYQAVVGNGIGSPVTSAAATLTVQAPATFAYLTNDLVLHLKFEGNYDDASGNANHGSFVDLVSPPVASFVPGKLGNGIQVGTNGYLWVLSAPSLTFGPTDSFSVAFWVKCGPGNNDVPIIGNAVNSTYQDGWVFSEDNDKIEWTLTGTTDNSQVIADPVPGSPIITDHAWHNIVASFDRVSNVAVTFVDGIQVDTRSIAGLGSLDSAQNITLGNDPTGTYIWDQVVYQVDDVGIWRRVLTPGEASGIYAAAQIGQSFDVKGPGSLTLQKSGGNLELIWQQGTLQSLDSLGGTWVDVVGAVAPYHVVTPNAAQKFYRVKF